MGDRAMAEIKVDNGSLYFYTHWSGHKLPKIAKGALKESLPRRGDYPYALKIVIDSLILGCGARDQETGAGIMLGPDAEDKYNSDSPRVIIYLFQNKVTVIRHQEVEA